MPYQRFRYPSVRRRPGEDADTYWARRAETRSKAMRAYSERMQSERERPRPAQKWECAFESYGDFLNRAEGPESMPTLGRMSRNAPDYDELEPWSGTKTFEQAAKLARYGWADGAEQLAEITAKLSGKLANAGHAQRIGFDVMGPGTLDVGRWAVGHPECMMVWQPTEELTSLNPNRILRICVSGFHAGVTPHHQTFWRGAAAFAIADMAEAQGVRAEIELVYTGSGFINYQTRTVSTQRVMLKRAQDPMDTDLLAFALCHPSAFRRIGFAVQETLPETERKAQGFTRTGFYSTRRELEPDEYGDAIYIPADCSPFDTPEGTAQWVVAKLAEHEIEVDKL